MYPTHVCWVHEESHAFLFFFGFTINFVIRQKHFHTNDKIDHLTTCVTNFMYANITCASLALLHISNLLIYTEFYFLQVLLGLLIPCMSRISTSAMS